MVDQTSIFDEEKANNEHSAILYVAHDVFKERNALRGDEWKDHPLSRHLDNIKTKVGRIQKMLDMDRPVDPKDLDEAIDIINYGAFAYYELRTAFIQQARFDDMDRSTHGY